MSPRYVVKKQIETLTSTIGETAVKGAVQHNLCICDGVHDFTCNIKSESNNEISVFVDPHLAVEYITNTVVPRWLVKICRIMLAWVDAWISN